MPKEKSLHAAYLEAILTALFLFKSFGGGSGRGSGSGTGCAPQHGAGSARAMLRRERKLYGIRNQEFPNSKFLPLFSFDARLIFYKSAYIQL